MTSIILGIIVVLLIAALVVCVGIIRGFLRVEKPIATGVRPLTGYEIEVVRRRLLSIGMQAITPLDVFCLIKTIRDTNLGIWVDQDPYSPADPYEDIDKIV